MIRIYWHLITTNQSQDYLKEDFLNSNHKFQILFRYQAKNLENLLQFPINVLLRASNHRNQLGIKRTTKVSGRLMICLI